MCGCRRGCRTLWLPLGNLTAKYSMGRVTGEIKAGDFADWDRISSRT